MGISDLAREFIVREDQLQDQVTALQQTIALFIMAAGEQKKPGVYQLRVTAAAKKRYDAAILNATKAVSLSSRPAGKATVYTVTVADVPQEEETDEPGR